MLVKKINCLSQKRHNYQLIQFDRFELRNYSNCMQMRTLLEDKHIISQVKQLRGRRMYLIIYFPRSIQVFKPS